MSNRWVRFLFAVVAIAASAGAAYRVTQDELRLARDATAARAAGFVAETALTAVSELRATLHAYVAPGQGHDFWAGRAGILIDKLRASILGLDPMATASGASLTEALDVVDRLAAADQRAREHARLGQALLAGDIIFTEARDLLDGLRLQIAHARDLIATAAGTRQTAIRREQTWLVGGAVGILALVMLLLVPQGRAAPEAPDASATPSGPATPSASAPVATSAAVSAPVDLSAAAEVCTDLARLADGKEISGLLARASSILGASGVIVWVSSEDGRELYPVASVGYDERLFARIGSIDRQAANLTAAAFRDGTIHASAALGPSSAALAIPLAGPQGAVGVFSAEIRDVSEIDSSRTALAGIFAAQLATLIGSMPAPESAPQQAQKA